MRRRKMLFWDPTNISFMIGGSFAFAVGVAIISKDFRELINVLFGIAYIFWGGSLLANAFTFLFLSPTIGANLVRDLSTTLGIMASFFIFAAGFSMYFGTYKLKKWFFLIPWSFTMLSVSIIVSIFDIVVVDNELGEGIKTTQPPWVIALLYGVPLILIVTTQVFLAKVRQQIQERIIRIRILSFIVGLLFIILGSVIYAIFGFIEQIFSLDISSFEYITWIFASFFWALGPILKLVGFFIGKVKIKSQEEKLEEQPV